MDPISSIALSGLHAARQRLQVSAHNVANLGTEGFHAQRVVSHSEAGAGVGTRVVTAAEPGVDLLTEAVEQLSAVYAFRANLISLQRADSLLGTLLDELA